MSNFSRVLAITLRHRVTVAACLFCSVAVALLWGGNITPLYWVVDVVMLDKSIPQWIEERQADRHAQIESLTTRIAAADERTNTGPENDRREAAYEHKNLLEERTRAEWSLSWYDKASPWAHKYLPTTAFGTLLFVCAWVVIGTLLKSAFRVAGTFFSARLGNLVALDLRKEFYRRTLRLDMARFSETTQGDLMNRFTGDVNVAANGAQNVYSMVIREPMRMIVCLAGAAWVSWQLLLLTLISAPLAGYAIHWLAKALKRANRKALEELSVLYDRLDETFSGMKVIKAFTQESHERSRFHLTSKQFYRRSMRIAVYDSLVAPTTEVAGMGIIVAAALCGGYLVLNRQTHLFGIRISDEPLTHGYMTLFFSMLVGASDPVRRLTGVFNSLQHGSAAADHLYELLDREPLIQDPPDAKPLPERLGSIEFKDLSFSYKPDEPVLQKVNLKVAANETIAIVGPNGCGKSTLMNLLLRFYDPTSGSITVGGVDLSQCRVRDLRERMGVVSQEILLFNDTVAENIRYGKLNATRAQIIKAAERAHAHKFITEKLADGYATMVGAGGSRLSGGQRQRIALARAILRDPEILILDEATSQIDVESERLIHDVLAEFTRDRTAFIITHRPSTLELADRIVVMNAGRVADVGRFDELAARCQLFRSLAHLDQRASA